MATKPKESSSVGKEKKVPPSSSSQSTATTRSSTKPSSTSSSTPKPSSSSPSPSSTSTEKPVPNYLKPTISSRHDEANLKPIKKHGADHHDPNQKATLNRRRSFDKPPSSSRVQSALVSPGPKERRTTGRSSSFSSKTPTTSSSSSSKPISDNNKPLRSPKPAKPQPTFPKSAKSTIPKKEASNASAMNRIPKSPPDQSQTVVVQNVEANQEATDQSLVHEVAEVESEVKVCPEEPTKPEDNDQHSGGVDGEVNSGDENEIKKSCDDVSNAISEEVKADIDDAGLEEKPADDTQLEAGDDQNKKNESHTEEGSASEAKEDVEEDKANEIAVEEITKVVEENKNDEGKTVDNEKEEVACEASNVTDKEKEKDVEEGKAEAEAEGSVKRQGKKDSAPAYNDVIEETASKLLEKRKNKVKALVGAFETVIDYESK